MKKEKLIFAFDLGTGSIGEAVRKGDEIIHAESLLIPHEFASTKDQATKRRFYRTRQAHKAREKWLKKICREAGIEVLEGRKPGNKKKGKAPVPGDPRLEREFPAPGDDTVYTSCLLRIMLLRGEKLEGWQVYKALHSAIQRRGYDPDIPWKHSRGDKNNDDEKENQELLQKFESEYSQMTNNFACKFPCYFEAWKMGIWDPVTGKICPRVDNQAGRARGYVVPRSEVIKELRSLLEKAAVFFPKLKGKIDYVLFGPAEKPYASYDEETRKKFGLKMGGTDDWQGVLGQKIPRFDNRVLNNCSLIPRYHVCRATDPLYWQVHFLLRLKNLRYLKDGNVCFLLVDEIKELFSKAREVEKKKRIKGKEEGKNIDPAKAYKLTKTQWATWCEKHGGMTIKNNAEVPAPKPLGRCRFSRPGMRVLRDLILSGDSPTKFRLGILNQVKKNRDPGKGLIEKDLDFLLRISDSWENIHVPAQNLESVVAASSSAQDAIKRVIGQQNDPVVRHRLRIFSDRLRILSDKYGEPDLIVLEFVREDFMGPKKKREYEKFHRDREKERKRAEEEAQKLGLGGRGSRLKVELLRQQGGICIYTGRTIPETGLETMEIEHIVPRGSPHYGPDSIMNKVITFVDVNKEKGNRTPFEWLSGTGEWDAYQQRVMNASSRLGKKKMNLLLAEDAGGLVERYTSLAETAWISRLSQTICHLRFGWPMGEKGSTRKVAVVSGGLTARVRRKYQLNGLLAPEGIDPSEVEKKVRSDDRHHALDAMVISYLPNWLMNPRKRGFFRLPPSVHKEYFREKIDTVVPRYLCREKSALEETIYARREIEGKQSAVVHKELSQLPLQNGNYTASRGLQHAQKVVDPRIRRDLTEFFSVGPSREDWETFLETYRLKGGNSSGSKVRRVAIRIGDISELEDISRDGSGQYRRGSSHNGYFIYLDSKEKPRVRPVYAYQSPREVRKNLENEGFKIVDYFFSNCLVEIEQDLDLGNRVIPKGRYTCSTIKADGRAVFRGAQPYLKNAINLARLLGVGFKRISG